MADMDIETDDEILRKVAIDGSMDYSSWPGLLPIVVARIERIAHNDFPIPRIPPPPPPARPASPQLVPPLPSSDPIEGAESSDTAPSSQENNKENANPSSSPTAARATASTTGASSSSTLQQSSSPAPPSSGNTILPSQQQQPQRQPEETPAPGTLPTPVVALLNEVTSTLTSSFNDYPPHTIQRLAELILRPRQHYRSLVSYLHALDRVVHVTSGANTYPLPPAVPDMSAMSLLANGVGGAGLGAPGAGGSTRLTINTVNAGSNNPGSDEALGGALLTPIPWLARRANGGGSSTGAGGSEDGSSDAGSASPVSSGSSSGGGSSAQQRQTTSPTGAGGGSGGRKVDPQIRTESTETIEGPNGMGSIETVSISVNGIPSMGAGAAGRGVTQGELLRQEQRAGVIPLSQLARHGQAVQQQQPALASGSVAGQADEDASMGEGETHGGDDAGEDEEIPHARGPQEIGAADMGPQPANTSTYVVSADGTVDMRGIDVEAAVGRRLQSPDPIELDQQLIPMSPKREAEDGLESSAAKKFKESNSEKDIHTDAEADAAVSDQGQAGNQAVVAPEAETAATKEVGEVPADRDKVTETAGAGVSAAGNEGGNTAATGD